MTAQDVLDELAALGRESLKRMLMKNHGVTEPCFGVKIVDMKKIVKRVKKDHALALALYDTGNYDAMYLAGLIADDARMTKRDLQKWVKNAEGGCLATATVAWVATGGPHGWEMALKWIDSNKDREIAAGWATLSGLVSIKEDADLDLPALKRLLRRVEKTMDAASDTARHGMNGFVIALGCHVAPLTELCLETAERIGPVTADLGNNQCKVPYAPDYIRKVQERGSIGKKRKTVKC